MRAVVFVALMLAAAVTQVSAQSIEGFLPLPQYEQWYHQAATMCRCAPAVEFGQIDWYRQSGRYVKLTGVPRNVAAMWMLSGTRHSILIADHWLNHEIRVKHELLHAITGRGDHDHWLFKWYPDPSHG